MAELKARAGAKLEEEQQQDKDKANIVKAAGRREKVKIPRLSHHRTVPSTTLRTPIPG
ncbi:hypothetical protein [Neomoorella mulderi]|uniref:hypothetical protein n=1 Tax=Neomoorella mulderi TaxID=202604 RepID=UPI000B1813F3|nr:hypothetical protein [Moorella mulderi]